MTSDRARCDPRSNHPYNLAQGDAPSPAEPLHAVAPDQRTACLPHYDDCAGHSRHSQLPAQFDSHEGVYREGSYEPGRTEALGHEEHNRYLPGDAGIVPHAFLLYTILTDALPSTT